MNTVPQNAPNRIVTSWRRFSCGLWRMPQGDISEAYSAEIMPRVKVFTHDGRLYTSGGSSSKWVLAEAYAHALIHPDEYQGPETAPYSYEGRTVTHRGKTYRLGPKTLFVSTDPTIDEWRHLCHVLYADGGYFASGCTYMEFVDGRFNPDSVNGREAKFKELAECGAQQMPRTQEEMRRLLAGEVINQLQQIDFAL